MSDRNSTRGRASAKRFAALLLGALVAVAADRLFAATNPPPLLGRDESFVVRFASSAPLGRAQGGGLAVLDSTGAPARGAFVAGRPLVDSGTGRQVVVRPEALREYHELVLGMSPDDADRETRRVLARVEKTGDVRPLDAITAALRTTFGPSAGVRLDDPTTTAFFAASDSSDAPSFGLRQMIAGDDAKWRAYLGQGDVSAFAALQNDARFERFHHALDPLTGEPDARSTLRLRENRRALMRRSAKAFTFVPDLPIRADLADEGLVPGTTYSVHANGIRPRDLVATGGVAKFVRGLTTFVTAPDAEETSASAVAPRVVNVTPPDGESFIDFTTDWEDPDDMYVTPMAARRAFVVRVRFSRPLDPRTVNTTHFTLTKTGGSVSVPIAVDVFLVQHRLGEVVVEITPQTNLDPISTYEIRVDGTVRGLDGAALGASFTSRF